MEELQSLADLLDLQDVDLQIDRLIHERQTHPALEQFRVAHEDAAAIEKELNEARSELRETTLALDRTNGELDISESKLAAEQNRLFAGGMSARDADYLRREVEMLERKQKEQEEEILALMERREKQEARVAELTESLAAARTVRAGHETVIEEAWREIDARLARKEARKAEIIPLIDPDLLTLYDELRATKDGVAVGRLAEGTCGGCHLRLTSAERLEAKKSDPPRCIHCRRILVP
ncbi:MAG: hypothetical protein PVI35_07315 [Acidimicrobiia bacterium]|jgi:hypothetical protein